MTNTLPKTVSVKIPTLYLTQLVSKIARLLPKQTANDLLKGIHLQVTEDAITASVYNGLIAVRVTKDMESPLKLSMPIDVVLMHPRISSVFSQLKGAETTLKYDIARQSIEFKSNKSKYKVGALNSESYPNLDDIIDAAPRIGTLTAELIKASYIHIPKFVSQEAARPTLQGVLHNVQADGKIILTATDAHTLRTRSIPYFSEIQEDTSLVVPGSVLMEVSGLIGKIDDEKVYLHANQKAVAYHWEDEEQSLSYALHSSLIDGNYPDTSRLSINESGPESKVRFVRSEVEQAIKRVLVGTVGESSSNNSIYFAVKGRQARVFTVGEFPAVEDFATESNFDEEFVSAYNAQYLLKALQTFRSDEIVLSLTATMRPIFFEDPSQIEGVALTLPIRMNENVTVDWPEVVESFEFEAQPAVADPTPTPAVQSPTPEVVSAPVTEQAAPPAQEDTVNCFVDTFSKPGFYFVTYRSTRVEEDAWGGYEVDATPEAVALINAQICQSENVKIQDVIYE